VVAVAHRSIVPRAAEEPDYEESKRVAEASREADWKQPSFGRRRFMGDLRLDLIHPQPEPDGELTERGERFLGQLRAFLTEHVDPLAIERDAKIRASVIDGLKRLGALGIKIRSSTAVSASRGSPTTAHSRSRPPATPRCARC
jgi:hypothetical protein